MTINAYHARVRIDMTPTGSQIEGSSHIETVPISFVQTEKDESRNAWRISKRDFDLHFHSYQNRMIEPDGSDCAAMTSATEAAGFGATPERAVEILIERHRQEVRDAQAAVVEASNELERVAGMERRFR